MKKLLIPLLFFSLTISAQVSTQRAVEIAEQAATNKANSAKAELRAEIANIPTNSADYFMSLDGKDSNPGTYSLPWKTLDKLQSSLATIPNGSIIAFRAGDKFTGDLDLTDKDNITFTKYGDGENPVLTGMEDISGWVNYKPNIYRTAINITSSIRYVTVNGVQYLKGKWPENGYNFITASSSTDYFIDTDSLLQADNYWNGAEVVFRLNAYWFQVKTVADFTNSTARIDFSSSAIYPLLDEPAYITGYFFQNNIHCLNSNGDWMWTGDSLYLYYDKNPDLETVQASLYNNAITTTYGATNLTLENINITGYNNDAIHNVGGTGFNVLNCDISYCLRAVYLYDAANNYLIQNCKLSNLALFGLHATDTDYGTIEDNVISDIGMVPGYENNGEGLMGLFFSGCDTTVIQRNDIYNIGYNAIDHSTSDRMHVEKNRIRNYCQVTDDGGGIYSYWCEATHVTGFHHNYWKYNFVEGSDSTRMWESMRRSADYGAQIDGLYADGENSNLYIENNLVVNNNINILGNSLHDSYVTNNWTAKSYPSRNVWGMELNLVDVGPNVANNTFTGNKFIANYEGGYYIFPFFRLTADIQVTNSFDYNYWMLPTLNNNTPTYDTIIVAGGGASWGINQWIANQGGVNEKTDIKKWSAAYTNTLRGEYVTYDYNFSSVARAYYMVSGWTYYEPTTGSVVASLTLQPYTGHVLYRINNLDL